MKNVVAENITGQEGRTCNKARKKGLGACGLDFLGEGIISTGRQEKPLNSKEKE